jgi:Ras GTPase-activating-like protein IQGAP2/3
MATGADSKVTKAAALLKQLAQEEDERNLELRSSTNSSFSITANNVKKHERPLNSVQQMILAKEQETKENKSIDFTPRPDNKSFTNMKSIFVSQPQPQPLQRQNQNHNQKQIQQQYLNPLRDNKFTKSEQKRANEINNAISGSPSKQNLNKLKNIQLRLTSNPKPIESILTSGNSLDKISNTSLPKTFSTKNLNKQIKTSSSIAIKSWLDYDRDNIKLASFVCRMIEIKRWIEKILNISIGLDDTHIDQFPDYLTNGIILVQLAKYFDPNNTTEKIQGVKENESIQYKMTSKNFKFTENILTFLNFVNRVKLPYVFIFETNDLYEKKDIPKVIACLHALSCLMKSLGKCPPVETLTNGPDTSVALSDLKFDIDNLKQIKYSIGRNSLSRKYIEGFDEAVRVNIGEDIKKLQLVQINEQKNNDKITSYSIDEKELNNVEEVNDISFLTIDEENELTLSSIEIDLHSNIDLTEPSSPESPKILPPSSYEQEETRNARDLFNDYSFNHQIPTSTSIASITAIQEKYKFLISEEEREILGDSYISKPISVGYQSTDPNINVIILQSLARGYLLRFDLFVTKAILKANTASIIKFQSICRGKLARNRYNFGSHVSNERKTSNEIGEDIDISELTTIFGSSQMMRTILKNKTKHTQLIENLSSLRKEEFDVISLQSLIRSMFVRQRYWKVRKFLLHELNSIIKLQSLIRGSILRNNLKNNKPRDLYRRRRKPPVALGKPLFKKDKVKEIASVHDSSRSSHPLLSPYEEDELFERFDIPTSPSNKQLDNAREDKIPRRKELKRETNKYVPNLPISEPITPPKECRKISNIHHSPTKKSLSSYISTPTSSNAKVLFPPVSSGHGLSSNDLNEYQLDITSDQLESLKKDHSKNVIEFQSILRGAILRSKLTNKINEISLHLKTFNNFVSCARGNLARQAYRQIRKQLYECQNEIITIQSVFRSIETRVDYDCLVEDIQDYAHDIVGFQNHARGFLVRKKIKDRDAWFKRPDNLLKICKLQAIIRGIHGVHDYRALIEERNPPLRAIKKFIGLLTSLEAERSNNNELEIIKMREDISIEKSKVKLELDRLNKLKIKVGILKKFGIDIKSVEGGLENNVEKGNEVLRQLVDVNDVISVLSRNNNGISNSIEDDDKIISIKKETNEISEFVGTFFKILQYKPEYWSRVLNYIEMTQDDVDFSYGNIEDWILTCYNYCDINENFTVEPTREEYLYMKLILNTFSLFISRISDTEFKNLVKNRSNLTVSNIKYWELLLHGYLNLPQQRKLTKELLGDSVLLITSDDEVTFECEPMKIFRSLVERTNLISDRERLEVEIGTIEPLELKPVEQQYIKNIQDLRTCSYEIFKNLKKIVKDFPIFIKVIIKEFYNKINETIGDQIPEIYRLSMVGSVLMQCYILPIFQNLSNYSINIYSISDNVQVVENIARNLELVSILLNQCSCMKKFESSEYPFLKSLDPFIEDIKDEMKEFLFDVMNISTIDLLYQKTLLEGEIESNLKIQYDDIIELVFIWKIFLKEIIGEAGDILAITIKEIEGFIDINNKSKTKKLPCDAYGYCNVRFNNIAVDDEEEMLKLLSDRLLVEVKTYLIYVLQVQDGKDLVELLVSPIEPADEIKFKELIKHERKIMKNAYKIPIIKEIHNASFPQVKKKLVEIIFELENLGIIDANNGYQTLINNLADDIKHKREQQKDLESEKILIVEILTELKRRCHTYEKKYTEYEDKVKSIMNEKLLKHLNKYDGESYDNNNHKFLSKFFSRSGRKIKRRLRAYSNASDADYGTHKMSMRNLIDKGVVKSNDGKLNKGTLVMNCYKPGHISMILSPGGQIFNVTLDQLLTWVYEEKMTVPGFTSVDFVCVGLLKTVLQNFYN